MLRADLARAMLVAGIAILAGLVVTVVPALIALVLPAGLGIVALALLVAALRSDSTETRRTLLIWTAVSFGAHLVIGLGLHHSGIWTFLGPDAQTYDRGARQLVEHWARDLPMSPLPSGKEGMFYMLGGLYRVFGTHPEAGLAVNATMAAGLLPLLYDTTDRLFGERAARFVIPIVLVLPGFLIWPAQLLREAGVLFLVAVAANCGVRLADRISVGPFVALASALALLFTFRGNVALIVAGGLVPGLALGKRELLSGLSTGVSTLSVLLLIVLGLGLGYSGYNISANADLKDINTVRSGLSTGVSSGIAPDADVSTTKQALSYLPIGVPAFLLGPFPWQMRSVRQLVAFPDVVLWWALLPSLWRGLTSARERVGRRMVVLVLPAALVTLALSLLIGNFGTVVRERMQIVVLVTPFLALGLAERRAASALQPAGSTVPHK